jgi:hypothetical protein
MPKRVMNRYLFKASRAEEHAIRDYVESQTHRERVQHLEKVGSEHLFDRTLDCWDVHTGRDRYWVITSPTNLYPQKYFPSLDYALTFHIGLSARIAARHEAPVDDVQHRRLLPIWRRWEDASEAVDLAEEPEEFQAVGMRCRECLLHLIRALSRPEMVPEGNDPPKRADFVHWSELIANAIACGASAADVRAYLKVISSATWQLVNWLTHASTAGRNDAAAVVEATQAVLAAFGRALMRHEANSPDRCPECGSHHLSVGFNPALSRPYVHACEKCGWIDREELQPKPPRVRGARSVVVSRTGA